MRDACQRWRPFLHDWSEGIADPEEELLARAHLSRCPDCQQILIEWEEVREWIRKAFLIPAPPRLSGGWKARPHQTSPSPWAWTEGVFVWGIIVGTVIGATLWLRFSLASLFVALLGWVGTFWRFPL